MLELQGDTIKMTKGDDARLDLVIYTTDDCVYTPEEGDTLVFRLYNFPRKSKTEKPILVKTINDLEVSLKPQDTNFLKDGKYFYDITLTFKDGEINTIMEGEFFLLW